MEPSRAKPARRDLRILVLAPTGRDGQLAAEVLGSGGLACHRCGDPGELRAEAQKGAGAMLVAGEALDLDGRRAIGEVLRTQPFWSELPVIVLARQGEDLASLHAAFDSQYNMTFLERPVQIGTLLSAVQAALRARQRQYEVRDLVEQLRETDRRKDEFLAMLGHELRNPLGVIRTALELLRSCDDPQGSTRQVTRIDHQIGHLSRMVDDLLDLSRVSRGRIVLRRQPCELGALVAAVIDDSGAASQGRAVDLRRSEEPLWVDGDPVRLEQVVTNLVQNALKYTPAGKQVAVNVERDRGWAVLRVEDDGIGIAPDELELIFETFTQASTSLARSGGGLGLGLSLVRHLVRLHRGQVSATSDGPGKGSQFVVRLPLLPQQRAWEAARGAPSREQAGEGLAADPVGVAVSGTGREEAAVEPHAGNGVEPLATERAPAALPRVLVVEDLDDAREALGELLDLYGFTVELAADGPSGVEAAFRTSPEIALIDIGLPGLDGYQVARRVRERFGDRVYMVAMTGYGQAEDRRKAREAGFDHHLVKPVSPERLLELLRRPRPGAGEGQGDAAEHAR